MNEKQRELAEQNIGIVYFTIGKYFGTQSAFDEDLVSAGYEGLCIAAEGYDPSKGKFSTYAAQCIRYCVIAEIRAQSKHSKNIYMSNASAVVEESTYDGHYGEVEEGFADVDVDDQLVQFEQLLDERERTILNLSKKGKSPLDISIEIGVPRWKVYSVIREIKTLWELYRRNE